MKTLKLIVYILFIMLSTYFSQTTDLNKPQKLITDDSIKANQHITFYKDTVYVLEGYVFVEENAILEIEPGTVVKAKNTENYKCTLVIMQGAKIIAEGTMEKPIIFTSVNDSLVNLYKPGLQEIEKYYWGGIIICGRSTANSLSDGTDSWQYLKINDKVAVFGGQNDDDDSGVLTYITLKYGGANVPEASAGGFVFSGCGKGTIVNHIESVCSETVDYQFIGGAINCKNIASSLSRGLSINIDRGYRGKLQFVFLIKDTIESSGQVFFAANNEDPYLGSNEPKTNYEIYNLTIIGNSNLHDFGYIRDVMRFYNGTQGRNKNSIINQFTFAPVTVDDDTYDALNTGELSITNNIWWLNENYIVFDSMKVQENIIPYLNANNNIIIDPLLYGISRTNNGGLDPRPRPESPAWTMELADYPNDGFFEPVNYAGAFGTENWLEGWSWLWQMGYFDTTSTSIESPPESIPADYRLEQNYPNPFNPSTIIKYSISVDDANFASSSTHVTLKVFDILGREVATLVNEYQSAGTYEVEFDGSNLSSGIYFYSLKSGSYTQTRKMVLMK